MEQKQQSSPTKSSSSFSSSSESVNSYSSTGSFHLEFKNQQKQPIEQESELEKEYTNQQIEFIFNDSSSLNTKVNKIDLKFFDENFMYSHEFSSKKDTQPLSIYDNEESLNANYDYWSHESMSLSTSTPDIDMSPDELDQNDYCKNLSKNLRFQIENLIQTNSSLYNDSFISSLFSIFYKSNFKVSNFRQIYNELLQSNVIRNLFLLFAKVGNECFKLGLLTTCEYLLEFALDEIDTNSTKLKLATYSTLSACYWHQSKYVQSISSMNSELQLAYMLNQSTDEISDESFNSNRYRIYGNLASAYQRLNKHDDCLDNFELQLNVATEINDQSLIINTLNSIGLVYNRLKDYKKSLEYFEKSLNIIESTNLNQVNSLNSLKFKQKQLNLIGEVYLKLNNYDEAKNYFHKQLEIYKELFDSNKNQQQNDNLEQHFLNQSITTLNLGFVYSKLKSYQQSVEFYEKSLNLMQENLNIDTQNLKLKQQIIEIYGRLYTGLVNAYLQLKDNLHALLYAHGMLDFTLKEMVKLNNEQSKLKIEYQDDDKELFDLKRVEYYYDKRLKYLKYLEMAACSKLASCYSKQNRLKDAYKLYQRESTLAIQLNNILHLTRAYSHMAQINYINQEYEQCINLYKQILHSIEQNLLNRKISDSDQIDSNIKDERLIQMIYFTLSNIGLCMEMMKKHDDALLMFQEQYEVSKLIKNLKFRANALLNLVNLYLNKAKLNENFNKNIFESTETDLKNDTNELFKLLNELYEVYINLNDLNGQLFTSQCLAYSYHTSGKLRKAIDFYLINIEISKILKQNDSLSKSLFNLSLCYKNLGLYMDAYKHQMDYFNLIDKLNQNNDYNKFISMGLMAELMFEIDSSFDSYQNCIQIQVDRLKILKSSTNLVESVDETTINSDTKSNFKSITSENKCKLISDCLESIAKFYYQMNDYQQVLKFKFLQLDLQNEIEASIIQSSRELQSNNISGDILNVKKQKCKLWFDIGNLFLFKFENPNESLKYFEQVLKISIETNDLLLESLTLGNLGLCKQKVGDYLSAIDYFKKQIYVLDKKLKSINEPSLIIISNNSNTKLINTPEISFSSSSSSLKIKSNSIDDVSKQTNHPYVKITNKNIELIKEIISIRIDMGRAYAKIGKCSELLSHNKISPQLYLKEALNYYKEYCNECEYLYETYVKSYFSTVKINIQDNLENEDEEELKDIINFKMKELSEQVYIDYDTSLAKMASFNLAHKYLIEKSIELNEKRLRIFKTSSKFLLSTSSLKNLQVQICYTLANIYSKQEKSMLTSLEFCENVIKLYVDDQDDKNLKDDIYLIETLNLYSDISVVKFSHKIEFENILEKITESYKLVWRHTKINDSKILQLKYVTMCRLCSIYRKLKMIKECLEVLMDSLNKFTKEFQQLHDQTNDQIQERNLATDKNLLLTKNFCQIQYIEYLFLIHRKISLIHIKHGIETNLKLRNKSILLLALKHVNESLMYLNYQKEFQSGHIIEFRQASLFYLFGKCHKYLKNGEMELEMFANSLDLYENLIPQSSYNKETSIKDRIFSLEPKFNNFDSLDEMFDTFRHDYDDETVVNYVERIDCLYQFIEDVLIRMKKYKEALLVTERHRTKLCSHLNNLQDFLSFDQIDQLLRDKNLHSALYFSKLDVSSTVNCWLLKPASSNIASSSLVKFHQINSELFEGLFQVQSKDLSFSFNHDNDEKTQNYLLNELYNILLKPFESFLFNNENSVNIIKPYLCIILDESMFKVPFHLLKPSHVNSNNMNNLTNKYNENYLYDYFELDCMYSLKYLAKSSNYNQRYTKHQNEYSFTIPMKVISNQNEMEKLLSNYTNTNSKFQFDMLLLLINQEQDINDLNNLANNLMSKRITKSILFHFNNVNDENDPKAEYNKIEDNSKAFLKKLYSKMLNRTTLNSTLIYKTLMEDKTNQKSLMNYLLFGNLGIYQIQNLAVNLNINNQTNLLDDKTPTRDIDKPIQENKINIELKRNNSLEDVLLELTQEDTDVTFGQVVAQYLKLNSKLDNPILVLDIIIFILDDVLNGSMKNLETISFINLFEKYSKHHIQNNAITGSRQMLKRLGFSFYIDKDGKYMVKLPDKFLSKKLALVLRCLHIFKVFSKYFLKELYDLTKTPNGKELLILMKQHQNNIKTKTIAITLKYSTYKTNESFLKEFTQVISQNEEENKIQLESSTDLFNKFLLISTIILNDQMKIEAEKSLQDYIEIFFKHEDENTPNFVYNKTYEDDLSSQYSTLSSIIGIQSNTKKQENSNDIYESKEKNFDKGIEIKIHRETSQSKISQEEIDNAKKFASKLQKMIKLDENVSQSKDTNQIYNKYLNELLENDLNTSKNNMKIFKTETTKKTVHSEKKLFNKNLDEFNETKMNSSYKLSDKLDNEFLEYEFKCKNLVRLEEKEYMDQIITTTTTVRTFKNDDLLLMLENNFEEFEYEKNNLVDNFKNTLNHNQNKFAQFNDNNSIKKSPAYILNINNKLNEKDPNSKVPNINKNIYSCLINYTYE